MPEVRGCHLPDDLLYDVDNHIWLKELEDGSIKIGMTSVATAMAGKLVALTPKKVGRAVQAGKTCATVESGKWVGPAKSAVGGEVVAVNDEAVEKPSLVNEDPYGAGWMVVLKPEDWVSVKPTLTIGAEVGPKYEARMQADGFAGCGCATGAKP
jgi:glycine cleavage system H protein